MRIGLLDLDTSHPAAWIHNLRELGHEIVGMYDGGAVHPHAYAAKFAAKDGYDGAAFAASCRKMRCRGGAS
jgi:hypothetical protein